jgi:hypothetical protein
MDINTSAASEVHGSRQYAANLGADEDTVNGEEQHQLGALLQLDTLHGTYPALDYLQYQGTGHPSSFHCVNV